MIKLLFNYPLPPFLFLCNLLFPPPPHLMGSLGDTPDAENPFTKQQIQQSNVYLLDRLTVPRSTTWRKRVPIFGELIDITSRILINNKSKGFYWVSANFGLQMSTYILLNKIEMCHWLQGIRAIWHNVLINNYWIIISMSINCIYCRYQQEDCLLTKSLVNTFIHSHYHYSTNNPSFVLNGVASFPSFI